MNHFVRSTGAAILKIAAVVIASHLAIMYFRLGWFLPIVWAIGLVLSLVWTKRQWKSGRSRIAGVSAVVILFATVTTAAWRLLFDRKDVVTFEMSWADHGENNTFNEPEIVLSFTQFPGHSVSIFSRELREILQRGDNSEVDVAFETTRDLGCLRGYREVRIAGATSWRSKWGYSSSDGSSPAPWGRKQWWCP